MKEKLLCAYLRTKNRIRNFFMDESGEANVIAIILIIIVVIGLVVIFRDKITALINKLFNKVDNAVDSF